MSSNEPLHKSLFYKDSDGRTRLRDSTEATLTDYEPVDFSSSKGFSPGKRNLSKEKSKGNNTAIKVALVAAAAIIGLPFL